MNKRCMWVIGFSDNLASLLFVCLMVFNATFNTISVISWRSILLGEETGVPGENQRSVASHWQTLSYNGVHLALIEIRTHNISDDSVVNPTTLVIVYLLSHKDVIRTIYITFFKTFFVVNFFYHDNCLGCLNGSYSTDGDGGFNDYHYY